MTTPTAKPLRTTAALHGTSRAAVDAVLAVTGIVEDMHRTIAQLSAPLGRAAPGKTRGITGLVYRSVKGITGVVGQALDLGLGRLTPWLLDTSAGKAAQKGVKARLSASPTVGKGGGALPDAAAVLSALNGVVGDYLANSSNPLAIDIGLRQHGQPLALQGQTNGKLLVLVHGLCMNDAQWLWQGHDHGAQLAQDLGYTALYLRYNTGRAIATNGRDFADLLEELVQSWPVPVTELALVCHSMGGLVARSACLQASESGQQWLKKLKKIVFLGTPHLGAPLERAGSWVDFLLSVSPYSAPLARLTLVRSAGIQDLRHGRVLSAAQATLIDALRLPARVKCFAVAASLTRAPNQRLRGDRLVPVASALGLALPQARKRVVYATDHFALLGSAQVYGWLYAWLQ